MKQDMTLRRRQLLLVGAAVTIQAVTAGCTRAEAMLGKISRAVRISAPTPHELELLANIKTRRTALGNKQLVIAGRLFDADMRLEDFELENTLFKDCEFVGCTMLRGVLRNVSFENCAFVANRWKNGPWKDVSFSSCAWSGHFKMGSTAVKGNVRFDDCEFTGSTPIEMGYGGKIDTYGAVGATSGDVSYNKCRFQHTYINGGVSLHVQSSTLTDCNLVVGTGGSVLVENVTGSGFITIEAADDISSSIIVRDSKFGGPLNLRNLQMKTGTFERFVANLDLSIVKAEKIDVRNVTFTSPDDADPYFRYGFDAESARIGSLNIIDCDFRGAASALCLGGRPEYKTDEKDANGNDIYTTEMATGIDKLTIHRTNLIGARLQYMKVGELRLEDLAVKDSDFSESKINMLSLRQVRMDGKVEFANTVITHKQAESVTDRSKGTPPVVGK